MGAEYWWIVIIFFSMWTLPTNYVIMTRFLVYWYNSILVDLTIFPADILTSIWNGLYAKKFLTKQFSNAFYKPRKISNVQKFNGKLFSSSSWQSPIFTGKGICLRILISLHPINMKIMKGVIFHRLIHDFLNLLKLIGIYRRNENKAVVKI